jgi:hypothetical protein
MNKNNQITGRQIAAARALAGMSQANLAKAGNISVPTLAGMEVSDGPAPGLPNNVATVIAALEAAGVEFTNGDAPGVRLRKSKPASAAAAFIPLEDLNAENDE